ncbi:MAG: glutaredoxin family protein, partial [Candidatus Methylomirabilales bacterium]
MSAPPVRVTLYTKAECPLCEEMAAVVAAVGAEVPLQMTAVDIVGDPELLRR